jgi:hypothetical protein
MDLVDEPAMWFPGVDAHGKRWLAANRWVTRCLVAGLLLVGLSGFLRPSGPSLFSGAAAYNLFHLVAGLLALAIVRTGRPGMIAGFSLVFGLINLWQVAAGLAGLFPARLFDLRPGDHVLHLVVGGILVYVGGRGAAALGAAWR